MDRSHRLTRSQDIRRVRAEGRSYGHPLLTLVVCPNNLDRSRFGVSAGRSVGNAVQRNRAKRRLRQALRSVIPAVVPGWDVVLTARPSAGDVEWDELQAGVTSVCRRAGLTRNEDDDRSRT